MDPVTKSVTVATSTKKTRGRPRIRKPGEMTNYAIHISTSTKVKFVEKCSEEARVPAKVLSRLIDGYISGNIKI